MATQWIPNPQTPIKDEGKSHLFFAKMFFPFVFALWLVFVEALSAGEILISDSFWWFGSMTHKHTHQWSIIIYFTSMCSYYIVLEYFPYLCYIYLYVSTAPSTSNASEKHQRIQYYGKQMMPGIRHTVI